MPSGLPPPPTLIFSTRASASLSKPVAMLLQRLAALVDGDRLGQRHVAALEPTDDLLELLERFLEGHRPRREFGSCSAIRRSLIASSRPVISDRATCSGAGTSSARRGQIIAALEQADDPAAAMAVGRVASARPVTQAKSSSLQVQPGERIAPMGVEAGGDDDQVGREGVIAGSKRSAKARSMNSAPPSPAASGALKMLPTPVSDDRAGAGIERHLMGRAVEDRSGRPRRSPGCRCRDGRRSRRWRPAPAPCARWAWRAAITALLNRQKPMAWSPLGVVAGRPDGAEGVGHLAAHHRVHRKARGAGGVAQRPRSSAAEIHVSASSCDLAGLRHRGAHRGDVGLVVGGRQHRIVDRLGRLPLQRQELLFRKGGVDRPQAIGSLRMSLGYQMFEKDAVGNEERGHWRNPIGPRAAVSPGCG